jgi:ABC-type sugar transport system permease subunit
MGLYRTLFLFAQCGFGRRQTLLWMWLFQPNFGLINQLLKPLYDLLEWIPIEGIWMRTLPRSR